MLFLYSYTWQYEKLILFSTLTFLHPRQNNNYKNEHKWCRSRSNSMKHMVMRLCKEINLPLVISICNPDFFVFQQGKEHDHIKLIVYD